MKNTTNIIRMLFALVLLLAPAVAFAETVQLVISKSGSGAGTVASSPDGINCGSTCSADFNSGVWVTLTATPEVGFIFTGWLGEQCSGRGTCTVMMDVAKSVAATFSKQGDIDGNGKVEIQDAIVALQVVSGFTPAAPTDLYGDVNGNQKIDLSEAIYALQYIAGLRGNDSPVRTGTITIVKDAQPNDAQNFTFTSDQATIAPFLLDDDGDNTLLNQKGFSYLGPGSYTFTETPVSGWNLASIVCAPSGGTTTDITTGAATISLEAGADVTCTFTNVKTQPTGTGTLTIVKDAQPDDPQDFHFTTVGAGLSNFDLDDDPTDGTLPNSKTFTNLAAGISFTVTEDAVSGWTVPSIQCIVAVPGSTATFTDQLNRTFTVNLEAGADVTCTFTNVKTQPTGTGTLTIVKDAQPDDPQDFHFTTVGAGLSNFDLDDDPTDGTLPNSKTFTNLAAGISFTVTEDAVSGWTVPSIQCIVAVPGSTTTFTDQLNRTFTVNLEAGADVTCTFTNVKTQPVPFTANNAPTLQVSTQAMVPTVLMTSTSFTSTTTGGVTTANVTAGPAGVPNDGILTLANPSGDTLVGAVATLPSSILLASGFPALSMTSTSLGSSVGLVSADFGKWAIADALPPPLPSNSVITYITFAGGTQMTTTMPTSGTKTYTGKMTGVLANTPIGGSDDVSGDVTLTVNFANGTGAMTNGFLTSNIATFGGASTITPCVWPVTAAACTYSAYALWQGLSPSFTDISLSSGTVTGNSFSATVTTPDIVGATITTMTGNFYGATADEIAGTFTISGSGLILIGSFGAK